MRFSAQPGNGDGLEAILLQAAEGARTADACHVYLVGRSAEEAETVWVTEVWTDRAAHDAALKDDSARALIQQALPLLAGAPGAVELRSVGGKGIEA